MLSQLLSRLVSALIVVIGVATLVFLLIHMVPGDPVEVMLGESAQQSDRDQLRQALGLDQPVYIQLLEFYKGLLTLDLGKSIHSQQPITEVILERLPATVELALAGMIVAVLIAFPLGVLAATRRDTFWDSSSMTVSLLGVSIPNFVMGPLLILVFAVWAKLLPVSGREGWQSLILPAVTLGTALAAILSRMVRASLLEVLNEDYVRTARAKGLAPRRVIWGHAMRSAMLPVITLLGLQLGALLAGAVITETVFSWPGIGLLTIEAIQRRDYPVVQACVLLISCTYVVVNTLTDVVYAWLDPRIRMRRG